MPFGLCNTETSAAADPAHTALGPTPPWGPAGRGGACPCPRAGPPLVLHHVASFRKPTSQEPLAEVTGDSRFVSVKLLTERSGRWRCRPALGLPGWPGAAPSGAVPPKPHARRAVTGSAAPGGVRMCVASGWRPRCRGGAGNVRLFAFGWN